MSAINQTTRRFSPTYFSFFAIYGLVIPYLGRYLASYGISGQQIGWIMATIAGVNMFAPFLLEPLSKRIGKRVPVIRISLLLMAVIYACTMLDHSFSWLLVTYGIFGIFLSATLPQIEGLTLSNLGAHSDHYGKIRLWGSVGFVAAVWGVGSLLDVMPVQHLPWLGLGVILLTLLCTAMLQEKAGVTTTADSRPQEQSERFPWRAILPLLLCVMLWQMSLAPFNTFFDLHLKHSGHSGAAIGFLLSIGTASEVVVFLVMQRVFNRWGYFWPLMLALSSTVLRWCLVAWYPHLLGVMMGAQLMHALTFGVMHSVAMYLLSTRIPASHQGLGQVLYVATGMGLGAFIGNVWAGTIWSSSATRMFEVSAMIILLATAVAVVGLRPRTTAASTGQSGTAHPPQAANRLLSEQS